MAYFAPFAIHAGHRLPAAELSVAANAYRNLIVGLCDGSIDPLSRLAPEFTLPAGFCGR